MAAVKEVQEKKFIFTTKIVNEIIEKINDGVLIKRFENPWFKNEVGVRRHGISFALTEDEISEYIKCKVDIHYFAEKYCQVKTEDGSVGNINLRDYQKDILDLYCNGRFSILCGSRQIGKCIVFNTVVEVENLGEYRIGILYYQMISQFRKLTFLEKVKIRLYNILYLLEGNHKI